jgi:hypothetical protein
MPEDTAALATAAEAVENGDIAHNPWHFSAAAAVLPARSAGCLELAQTIASLP